MSGTAPDRGELLKRYQTALVRLEVTGTNVTGQVAQPRSGTGLVVGANGLIVTAGHVIRKDDDWAETAPGSGLRKRNVKVTGLDEQQVERFLGTASVWSVPGHDLALLWVKAQGLRAPPLANQVSRDNSSLVALLWGPAGVPEPVTADLVPTDQSCFPGLLTVRIGVVEGNSGAGLFDGRFRLTGIILNRLDDYRALAIPVARVKATIESNIKTEGTPKILEEELAAARRIIKRLLKREDWIRISSEWIRDMSNHNEWSDEFLQELINHYPHDFEFIWIVHKGREYRGLLHNS